MNGPKSGVITREEILRVDSSRMHDAYDRWPELAIEAFEAEYSAMDFGDITHVVFAGMGGSGAMGDMFSAIFSRTNIHVSNVKGYLLPRTADKETLVISTSISGNTVETLNILKSAAEIGCKSMAISSGGMMEEYCMKNGINFNRIQMVHSPRSSFATFLYAILKMLDGVIPLKRGEVTDSIGVLRSTRDAVAAGNLSDENPAISLARWIDGIPLIYYPYGLQAVAVRFKNSLQENAKSHAMAEDVIESSHNGIVAWERPSAVRPILIQGDEDYFKTKERWKILREYFERNSIDFREVHSVRGNILTKLINLIYVCDYCSIYKAVDSGIDPAPTASIDFIKDRLGG